MLALTWDAQGADPLHKQGGTTLTMDKQVCPGLQPTIIYSSLETVHIGQVLIIIAYLSLYCSNI